MRLRQPRKARTHETQESRRSLLTLLLRRRRGSRLGRRIRLERLVHGLDELLRRPETAVGTPTRFVVCGDSRGLHLLELIPLLDPLMAAVAYDGEYHAVAPN